MKFINKIICVLILLNFINASAQEKELINNDGIYFGLGTGTWFTTNTNNPLKNPVMINFNAEIKNNKNALGVSFDMFFLKTKQPLSVYLNNTLVSNERSFSGVNITLNYSREFYQANRFSFEAITGLGYGEIGFYNPNADIDVNKGGFLINPGINVHYAISNRYFMQFKLQYNIVNFSDTSKVTADLKGQYITAKLIFGTCIN